MGTSFQRIFQCQLGFKDVNTDWLKSKNERMRELSKEIIFSSKYSAKYCSTTDSAFRGKTLSTNELL